MSSTGMDQLAINGSAPVRTDPWPARAPWGEPEKQAAMAVFDRAIATGEPAGYNGDEEEAYCRAFAEFLGGGYADGVNSGTSAVYTALLALRLEPFTEVITPPITDPGGCMPVPLVNCIPVPADSAPGSYNAGAEQIEARITERTSAIIVAHIAGLPADMDPIMAVAERHNLPVIEDCAQAHGATYKGRSVGTFGRAAAFSTMAGKHHSTGPQGGVVFTRDPELAQVIRRASDRGKPFGLENATGPVLAALNLNSNDLAAAIGRVQLQKLPQIIAARRRTAAAIAEGCRSLRSVELNAGLPGTEGVYWFLLFRLDLSRLSVDKATFVDALRAEGIPVGASYYHAPTQQPWAQQRNVFGTSGLPWTSPLYQGDPDAVYELPNARATDRTHFIMTLHERVGEREVADILAALAKLEAAYLE